jgi:uncharacterized damage-inducible protein DinB
VLARARPRRRDFVPVSYDHDVTVAPFYEGWRKCNRRLIEGIRGLSDDQLKLRASSATWPIWAIAAHTAGARVYWLCGVFKEPGAETTPFTDPLSGRGWEDEEDHPRGATELVTALQTSWNVAEGVLAKWTPDMLSEEFARDVGGKIQMHTRQSVLMRLITHDAFHGGEISSILGAQGLPEIDLWRPDR